jgi:uncharacterized protein with HEPN domain
MIKDPLIFIDHILDSLNAIEKYSKDLSKEKLKKDRLKQSAIIRELEIIGEAAKNLPIPFKEENSEIEWKKISGMRDKLIHNYFGVDLEIVWDVIESDLPVLKERLEKILKRK